MRIVIAHSHLNPGGVTRIIESQIESLPNDSISVLVGSCLNSESIINRGAEITIIEALNYLENRKYSEKEAIDLLHKIHEQLISKLTPDSILHFHNLNLGKNPFVTYAVYLLAKGGYKIFNHAHDFAEDRPANLQFLEGILTGNFAQSIKEVLYPKLPNYHYGVLNSFDYERLISYGVNKDRIVWIPNPVTFTTTENISNKNKAKTEICNLLKLDNLKLLVTYPIRVIQRKNIGEFILLSILFSDTANFVVTQPPQNPVEIELYNKWTKFCSSKNINITFEAGIKVDFEKLLIGSDFCITTSYKEGFGMVYLEPWLLKTPVVGRDIDFISKDFRADGFEFPALYSNIKIEGEVDDFKDLSMEKQMELILNVKNDLKLKEQLFEQNPIFGSLFKKVPEAIIDKNVSIIKNNYSLEGYGIKLQKQYKTMVG